MQGSLVRIVGDVRNGTDTIATASSQLAAGNLKLSSRAEEQVASLEQTAASIEERCRMALFGRSRSDTPRTLQRLAHSKQKNKPSRPAEIIAIRALS